MLSIEQAFMESRERALSVAQSIAQRYNVTVEKVLGAIENNNCMRHFYLHAEDPKAVVYTFDSYSDGALLFYTNVYGGRLYNFYANLDKITSNICIKGFVDIHWNPYKKWVHTLFLDNYKPKVEYLDIKAPPFNATHKIDNYILSLFKKARLSQLWITNKYLIAEFSNIEIYYPIWDLPQKFAVPCKGEFIADDITNLHSIGFNKGIVSLQGHYRHVIGYPSVADRPLEIEIKEIDKVKKLEPNMCLKYQGDLIYPSIPKVLLNVLEDVTIGFTPNFDLALEVDGIYYIVPYRFELLVEHYEKGSDLHHYLVELDIEDPIDDDEWWE